MRDGPIIPRKAIYAIIPTMHDVTSAALVRGGQRRAAAPEHAAAWWWVTHTQKTIDKWTFFELLFFAGKEGSLEV